MTWKPLNKVCIASGCHRYTVTKYRVPEGWKYEAWRGKEWLCQCDSAAECQAACEVDSERQH